MKMSVCWMFMILLGCRLFRATHCHGTCTCNEKLDPVCATGKEEVHVPCPNVSADEMRLKLYKDDEVIHNLTCNFENNTWKCPQSHPHVSVRSLENKLLGFILHRLKCSSTGIYKCEGTVIYPPPLKTVQSNVSIHVLMEGKCKCCDSPNTPKTPSLEANWIWILIVTLLSIYSLTATATAFVIWVKMRKTDSQSDYMNTMPRAKDRRKKRRVQNPIPKHF